ncbi:response regulator [Streptomyces sp. HUAS TT7]|uniref:response regulator n=1 Tax=Streptomyces sp. HUAS TT7 TaxID=3447507 RepID=UPI003F65AE98
MAPSMQVLLVDDHEDNLFALQSALAPLGYPITTSTSGVTALKTALRGGIAVAILDVVMPEVNGFDVVRYLARLEQTRLIPVILVTGMSQNADLATRALQLSVAALMVKPIDPWALRIKVQYLYRTSHLLQAVPTQRQESARHPCARDIRTPDSSEGAFGSEGFQNP